MRVLIVEDDPLVGLDLKEELVARGYDALGPAISGEEALDIASAAHPDVALVDIDLQNHGEGVQVARRLRTELGVATVFVSGEGAAARANRDAAVAYLPKPYSPSDAVLAVEIALRLRDGEPPPNSVTGPLEIFADKGSQASAQFI